MLTQNFPHCSDGLLISALAVSIHSCLCLVFCGLWLYFCLLELTLSSISAALWSSRSRLCALVLVPFICLCLLCFAMRSPHGACPSAHGTRAPDRCPPHGQLIPQGRQHRVPAIGLSGSNWAAYPAADYKRYWYISNPAVLRHPHMHGTGFDPKGNISARRTARECCVRKRALSNRPARMIRDPSCRPRRGITGARAMPMELQWVQLQWPVLVGIWCIPPVSQISCGAAGGGGFGVCGWRGGVSVH